MELSYQSLLSASLLPQMQEHQVLKELKELSTVFTSKREEMEGYSLGPEKVVAYSLFYLPTNFPKLKFILELLPPEVVNEFKEYSFVDVGAGPGTYGLAFLDYFNGDIQGNLYSIDKSSEMLKQAKQYISHFFPNFKNHFYGSEVPIVKGKKNILFFGNSINEMQAKQVLDIIRHCDPEFIFFIEPGTPAMFEKALEIRKGAADKGYQVVYPCSDINLSCPMQRTLSEGGQDWCHQVLRMTHDPSIERLSQLIQRDRKSMPLISHVYRKGEEKLHGHQARFVRFINESKHSFVWEVCLPNEDELQLIQIEIPKKTLDKQEAKRFKKFSVGLGVDFKVTKKVRDDLWRVELTDYSGK